MQNKPGMAFLCFSYVNRVLDVSNRIGRNKRKEEIVPVAGKVHLFRPIPERITNPNES